MHNIEPYYNWRDRYIAEEDERSPFYGRQYNEFQFTTKIYNYFIHPQWDDIGSPTLYIKLIYTDYDEEFAILELIGEWNDCVNNDIMFLKREIIDKLINQGVYKFILIGENVLNFHSSESDYYEEWFEDIIEEGGWITALNFREHIVEEMQRIDIQQYIHLGNRFNSINWRTLKPQVLASTIEAILLRVISA